MRLAALIAGLSFHLPAAPAAIEKQFHVRIRMRDGVHLCANVYKPAGTLKLPTLLVRTPYNKGADLTPNYRVFVEQGYAVVVQDVRGRYHSEGVFEPFNQETPDGDDTLNWIARQPWSGGNVGMIGGSYLGIVQWRAALSGNPHLKAIFPVVSGDDDYRDRFYSPGGAMKLGQRLLWMSDNLRALGYAKPDLNRFIWHLPLRTADRAATGQRSGMYQKALDHPSHDSFWEAISVEQQLGRIHIPVFAVGGWYDNFVEGDLAAFAGLRRLGRPNRLLIGPWPHNMSYRFSTLDFGPQATAPLLKLQLEWFDRWLKNSGAGPAVAGPPLRIFVMGVNRWRDLDRWPPSNARPMVFYLTSRGRANTLDGDGALAAKQPRKPPPDEFVYDPWKPVPTLGGPVCCSPDVFPWGPLDQRPVEKRRDVLAYSSRPLKRDLEVVGPVRVVLYAATSAPDTDFTAKLVDVYPDGRAINLTDGILRLRYRVSVERPIPAKPGEIHRLVIDAGSTANVFRKGHSIRLDISSSNFPRFDRNPNTGRPLADESQLRPARQTIYHDRTHPSHLLLPVVE